jgi:multicomponent Na+:H+ antiporter subunit G
MIEWMTGLLLLLGAGFSLVAAIGVLRMPDFYVRMHAASKAGTLGAGLLLLAVALAAAEMGVIMRAIAAIVFLVITAPVAAHLLSRAAYGAGVPLWSGTRLDELRTTAGKPGDNGSAAPRAAETPERS